VLDRRTRSGAHEDKQAPGIGEFAGLVAHETSQPISAILLNCATARNHLSTPHPDLARARECIDRIERDAERARTIVQRLRLLITDVRPEYTALDLKLVIEGALATLEHEFAEAEVTVIRELRPDVPLVLGDRVQLEQVLVNLCSNAIDAMRSTSSGPRALTLATGLEGGQPFVTVRDSGPGVEPQSLDRLFEPRFTTKSEGMGLGLYISRSIVELHGGRLWTTSGATGASFCFTLRAASDPAEIAAASTNVARLPDRDALTATADRGGALSARTA